MNTFGKYSFLLRHIGICGYSWVYLINRNQYIEFKWRGVINSEAHVTRRLKTALQMFDKYAPFLLRLYSNLDVIHTVVKYHFVCCCYNVYCSKVDWGPNPTLICYVSSIQKIYGWKNPIFRNKCSTFYYQALLSVSKKIKHYISNFEIFIYI